MRSKNENDAQVPESSRRARISSRNLLKNYGSLCYSPEGNNPFALYERSFLKWPTALIIWARAEAKSLFLWLSCSVWGHSWSAKEICWEKYMSELQLGFIGVKILCKNRLCVCVRVWERERELARLPLFSPQKFPLVPIFKNCCKISVQFWTFASCALFIFQRTVS